VRLAVKTAGLLAFFKCSTKSPFGDFIVIDDGLQSTKVDIGTLARDFSHRAKIRDYEVAFTNFHDMHPIRATQWYEPI
jgi:hypothetical protein